MHDMRMHVLSSFRAGSPTGGIVRRPFLLDAAARSGPSRYEIDIVLEGIRHEYGFVLDDLRVSEEWAYRYPHGRAALVFHRRGDDIEIGSADRAQGRAVAKLLRPNALFLSTAASANHATLLPLYAWFERNLLLAEAGSRHIRQALTTQMLDGAGTRDNALAFLRAAPVRPLGSRAAQGGVRRPALPGRAIRRDPHSVGAAIRGDRSARRLRRTSTATTFSGGRGSTWRVTKS
jgi:uncharacterized protein